MSFFQKLAEAFRAPKDPIPKLPAKDAQLLHDINSSFANHGTTLPPADVSLEK